MDFARIFTVPVSELTTAELHEARTIIGWNKLQERIDAGVDFAKFPNGGKRSVELLEFLKSMNARLDQINAADMARQGKGR